MPDELKAAAERLLESATTPAEAVVYEETEEPRKLRSGNKVVFTQIGTGWLVGQLTFRWTDGETPMVGEKQGVVLESGELRAIHRDRGRWVVLDLTPAEGAVEAALAQLPVP